MRFLGVCGAVSSSVYLNPFRRSLTQGSLLRGTCCVIQLFMSQRLGLAANVWVDALAVTSKHCGDGFPIY